MEVQFWFAAGGPANGRLVEAWAASPRIVLLDVIGRLLFGERATAFLETPQLATPDFGIDDSLALGPRTASGVTTAIFGALVLPPLASDTAPPFRGQVCMIVRDRQAIMRFLASRYSMWRISRAAGQADRWSSGLAAGLQAIGHCTSISWVQRLIQHCLSASHPNGQRHLESHTSCRNTMGFSSAIFGPAFAPMQQQAVRIGRRANALAVDRASLVVEEAMQPRQCALRETRGNEGP